MTPEEAAIRARDADPDWTEEARVAIIDRRALLAEVDRLRLALGITEAQVDQLRAENATIPPDVHVWGLATDAERARILDAVLELPTWDKRSVPGGIIHVNRAAVLAAVSGEAAAAIEEGEA